MKTLDYTFQYGKLDWLLDGNRVTFSELKDQHYDLTFVNMENIIKKTLIRKENENVRSSMIQVLGLIFNFTEELYHNILLVNLRKLQEGKVPNKKSGLCGNLSDMIDVSLRVKQSIFLDRLLYKVTGSKNNFPVEGSSFEFYTNNDKFDKSTDFGQKRLKLVQSLIDEIVY